MALDSIIHRKKPSWFRRFIESPYPTIAKTLYSLRQRQLLSSPPPNNSEPKIKVVCISDTHNSQPSLPPGDLLIHAGDLTQTGTPAELQLQLNWLNSQPHTHKVVIAGNHDILLDRSRHPHPTYPRELLDWGSVIYLDRSSTTLEFPSPHPSTSSSSCYCGGGDGGGGGDGSSTRTLTLFGHPSTRKQGNWAFQHDPGVDVFSNSVRASGDVNAVDILITHSPPRYHLDVAGWGDGFLLRELWRVKPKLHIFGHVHEGYGREVLVYDGFEREYERVCGGKTGLRGLCEMVGGLVGSWWEGMTGREKRGRRERTVLVNASVVGGLKDDVGRKVQVVEI